jgi:cytochrome c oxidase assembly protein subunit 15
MIHKRYERYVWVVLAYTILVILWGAFVRATGSGAGCGDHWPLCNGEVIPRAPMLETIIEFSHRLTSGVLMLMVLGMTIFAFRLYPKGHIVRVGAVLSIVFVIIEALFGAALVLFELVADNSSMARAVAMSIHLINTLLLVAFVTMTGMWVRGVPRPDIVGRGRILGWIVLGVVMMLLLGASGAIAALGDTLFPAASLQEGLAQKFDPAAHFLIRLRVFASSDCDCHRCGDGRDCAGTRGIVSRGEYLPCTLGLARCVRGTTRIGCGQCHFTGTDSDSAVPPVVGRYDLGGLYHDGGISAQAHRC